MRFLKNENDSSISVILPGTIVPVHSIWTRARFSFVTTPLTNPSGYYINLNCIASFFVAVFLFLSLKTNFSGNEKN